MEISSIVYNPASAQQSRARSESEDILEKKLEEALKGEAAANPEEKAFKEAEKVEAAQTAQEKATVENREQSEKRQGRAIDVTV